MSKEGNQEETKKALRWSEVKDSLYVFSYIKPYRWYFAAGMLLLVLGSGLFMLFPMIVGMMVDIAEGSSQRFTLPQLTRALVVLLIAQTIFSYLRVMCFAITSEKGMADVRKALYQKFISLRLPFYEENRVGDLTSRITNDVAQLQSVFSITLAEFVRQVIILILGIIILIVFTPRLAVVMFATFPVIVVGAIYFGRFVRKLSKKRQEELAATNTTVVETLSNIRDVKAFTNENLERSRYGTAIDGVVTIALRLARYKARFASFIIAVLFGSIFFIIISGFKMVQADQMTLGELVQFITYTGILGASIGGLSNFYTEIVKAIGGTERIRDILDTDPEVMLDDAVPELQLEGALSFDQVSFSYPTRPDIPVLKEVSLRVPQGQKIALVGQSGSGKSTIARLLMRYYDLSSGMISVDGKDIRSYDITAFRQNVAIVPQEVVLFGGSIRDNIAYGKPNATDEEIIEAAEASNSWEYISKFPEQLDTLVGERGIQLSGGQRQRIAIARAILKNPAILILDEATSALDAESEYLVQTALERLMQGRTSIIIAHRLSTIKDVDTIYVLDNGRVAESGSHTELLQRDEGIYQNLIRLQFETPASSEQDAR